MKKSPVTQKQQKIVLACVDMLSDIAINELSGFVRIDHVVQFEAFPSSLLLSLLFEDALLYEQAKASERRYQQKLHGLMLKKGVILKNPSHNLRFLLSNS